MNGLRALRRARDRIDRDYAQRLAIATLATEAGYSLGQFIRAFDAAYGETPGRYRTRRRVERACELLRSVNLTITEVCMVVGFSSLGTSSRRFADLVGRSPSAYQQEAIVGCRNGTTAHARYKMPWWPLAPVAVILTLGYVTYQLWKGNPWQVIIAAGALAVGYLYYYAYLYPQRETRWTMPSAPHDEHAFDEPGGILMGPALEIHPVGGHETEN